jgi:hypothetical protein
MFIFFLNTVTTRAQIYTSNIRVEVNIPKVVSNKALAQTFKGIYDVQTSYCYYVAYGFNIGIGAKYTFTQIDWQKFGKWRGAYYAIYGGFLSGIYDVKVSEKQKFSLQMDVGYGQNKLGKLLVDTTQSLYQSVALFYQPKFQYHFYVDPNVAITINLSYCIFKSKFSPYPLKLNKEFAYQPSDIKGYNGYINFGLGVLLGFKGKRFKNVELPDYNSEWVPAEEP